MPGTVDGRAGTQGGQIALVAESVGFVALAVVLLMPVKVTTFVGAVYVPHGFVQVYDFDPQYQLRESVLALAAGMVAAVVAWLAVRLVRRRTVGRQPS